MTLEKRNQLLAAGIIICTFLLVFGPPQIGLPRAKHIIIVIAGGLSILFQVMTLKTTEKKSLNFVLLGLTIVAMLLMFMAY